MKNAYMFEELLQSFRRFNSSKTVVEHVFDVRERFTGSATLHSLRPRSLVSAARPL